MAGSRPMQTALLEDASEAFQVASEFSAEVKNSK